MNMENLLVVVDMQNDFITGSLANPMAQEIVDKVADYVYSFDGRVVYTRDTHFSDYLETQEGRNLPVPHCIIGTDGREIVPEVYIESTFLSKANIFDKCTFGSVDLAKYIRDNRYKSVTFCGVCTGICVLSNVVLVKSFCPEVEISVVENLCACVTKESHKNAIEAMKMLQVKIV